MTSITSFTRRAVPGLLMQCVVRAVWAIFDSDGSGEIDREEFASRDGLADSIIASMP